MAQGINTTWLPFVKCFLFLRIYFWQAKVNVGPVGRIIFSSHLLFSVFGFAVFASVLRRND